MSSMKKKKKTVGTTCLLLIDCQNDFTDSKKGSLYVTDADSDMEQIKEFIVENPHMIDNIILTQDWHPGYHISHPCFWKDKNGVRPKPNTLITKADVGQGKWIPQLEYPELINKNPELVAYSMKSLKSFVSKYLIKLESTGQMHTIWPYHCIQNTWGSEIHPDVQDGVAHWREYRRQQEKKEEVTYVLKGTHPQTEMYSAIQANVVLNDADETNVNESLLDQLFGYDFILVAGEASTHCVKYTLCDIVKAKKDRNEETIIIMITDFCSPVRVGEYALDMKKFHREMEKEIEFLTKDEVLRKFTTL